MIDCLTADDFYSRILLIRSAYSGALVLMEGPTDCLLFDHLLDRKHCLIVPCHGKENALGALSLAERFEVSGVLAIVDADYDVLDGVNPPSSSAFFTDCHDIDMMMAQSPAFERVAIELGSQNKASTLCGIRGLANLRDIVLESASRIGALRLHSHRLGLRLRLKGIKYLKFIHKHTVEVDVDEMIQTTLRQNTDCTVSPSALLNGVGDIVAEDVDPFHLCCGRDFLAVCEFVFRWAAGTKNDQIASPENIKRSLRLSYGITEFCQTALYRALAEWDERHRYTLFG